VQMKIQNTHKCANDEQLNEL